MGVSFGAVERWFDGVATVELDINCNRCFFARFGHCLSADEANHLLATAGSRNDIQLWCIAWMVRHTRFHRFSRLFTIVHCWHIMDHHL